MFFEIFTFQNFGFDDESLDESKMIEVVEKLLEAGKIVGALASSCDKQHGSQDYDDLGTFFSMRDRSNVDHRFIHKDLIYDMTSERLMEESINLHFFISNQHWESFHGA